MDLRWGCFVARPNNPATILKGHSPNNTAVCASILNQVSQGGGLATLDTVYPGSSVSSFSLNSTYIGCATQSQEAPGVPTQCNVLFTGTKTNGNKVLYTCQYQGTISKPDLILCNLPNTFNKLRNVTMAPIPIGSSVVGSSVVPALFTDDFRYTTISST